jgi:hypothetical protein
MANERFFPLSTLLVPFGGTFFPTRWDFFPKALKLLSHGIETSFPRHWDFFPKALGLSSQHRGTFFPRRWDFFPSMVGKMRQ